MTRTSAPQQAERGRPAPHRVRAPLRGRRRHAATSRSSHRSLVRCSAALDNRGVTIWCFAGGSRCRLQQGGVVLSGAVWIAAGLMPLLCVVCCGASSTVARPTSGHVSALRSPTLGLVPKALERFNQRGADASRRSWARVQASDVNAVNDDAEHGGGVKDEQ